MASILPTLRFIVQHPVASKRPLSAYWRYARWQVESRLRDEVVFDWIAGSKLVARNGMTGATGNIYCGLHEFADMAFLLHLLRPDDLFVDVGANVGSYTVLASAVCGAKTIAIEPDPETTKALRRNVDINQIRDRVSLVEAAAGAAAGTVRFSMGRDTTNHVAEGADGATRDVRMRTLDEVVGNGTPILIKMDVEGYEPEVVAGARVTLGKRSLAAVIAETVDPNVRSIMASHGFHCATYRPFERLLLDEKPSGRAATSHNTLFVRRDRLEDRLTSAVRREVRASLYEAGSAAVDRHSRSRGPSDMRPVPNRLSLQYALAPSLILLP